MELKMINNKRDIRHSLVMIKPLPLESVTKTGLYVDFMSNGERIRGDQPVKGIVVSTPSAFERDIPKGSIVMYSDLDGGFRAHVDGTEYFFTRPANIHAILPEEVNVEIPIYGVSK